jgi:hypothetical protein
VDVQRNGTGFELVTAAGTYRADHDRRTNADTGIGPARFRSLARRVMVVPAFALATEELPAGWCPASCPAGPVSDTYKIIHYRPQRRRPPPIISARQAHRGQLAEQGGAQLAYFADRFPDLDGAKVSHSWQGRFTCRRTGFRTLASTTTSLRSRLLRHRIRPRLPATRSRKDPTPR